MKKELAQHFLATSVLISLMSLFFFLRSGQSLLSYWPLWVGAIIGTILPDVDHFIYVYFLRPYELTSQRVMYEVKKGNLGEAWEVLSTTRNERNNLILHTVLFQVFILILSILVVSSSNSLLGRGIVVAFLLHLLVDEVIDYKATGNLVNWFKNIPLELDKVQLTIYLIGNFLAILVLGLVF